ncbi:MAG: hypothetical protein ACI8VJ_001088, partial [Polaribacter sp.]
KEKLRTFVLSCINYFFILVDFTAYLRVIRRNTRLGLLYFHIHTLVCLLSYF